MASSIFNSTTKSWEYAQKYRHDGQAWVEILNETEDNAVVLTSAFNEDSYIGKGTILQRDISEMPVHPKSEEYSAFMWEETPFSAAGGWGSKTSLNTSSWGTQPVHMYVTDSTHPECGFREMSGAVSIGTDSAEYNIYMNGPIPLPSWAVPAQNGDRGLAVYDIGTGIMREWFMVQNSTEVWKGGGSGYSIVRPGLKHLAEDNYALQQRRGISNVAGMHNSIGFIGISEAFNKKINHALCFTTSTMRMKYDDGSSYISWPARASDGKLEHYGPGGAKYDPNNVHHFHDGLPETPTHGQWGRLKDSVDPMHNPRTKEPYPEFTRVIIEAAKKYGVVATDTNLWCHAFNAEQGRTFKHLYGEDPWTTNGLLDRNYRDKFGKGGLSTDQFPWDMVEWAPVDWGRPSPDTNLRPGQLLPWFE